MGRLLARVLCVMLALVSLLPVALASVVRSDAVHDRVTAETTRLLEASGIRASYRVAVRLWPIALELVDVRVESVDGGEPFLVAPRASAHPKLFALLAGKVVIDQLVIDAPKARVVIDGDRIVNLGIDIPKSERSSDEPTRAPFSLISAMDAHVDLTLGKHRVVLARSDVDVMEDEGDDGGSSFEVAVRVGRADARIVRERPADPATGSPRVAFDEDVLCAFDLRARIDHDRLFVRRASGRGAIDFDAADGTSPGCELDDRDARNFDLSLGHVAVSLPLPEGEGELPQISGRVGARAPIALAQRLPQEPDVGGWVRVDADVSYVPGAKLPGVQGRVSVTDIRIEKYRFATEIVSELRVENDVVKSPLTTVAIANGMARLTDVEVRPYEVGIPIRTSLDADGADFTELMAELGVSQHSHVAWGLDHVHVPTFAGTIVPLRLDGNLTARTSRFAVMDGAVDAPGSSRIVGVPKADIRTHVAVTPDALRFENPHVTTTKAVIDGTLVSIGFGARLEVLVPRAKVDLSEISPLGSMPLAGQAEVSVNVIGRFEDPKLEGHGAIKDFVLSDIPFGDVLGASAELDGSVLTLRDVRAQKRKSVYEVPTARLDFGGPATMTLDAQAVTQALDLRDFLALWRLDDRRMLDDDPRFADYEATIATQAKVHVALGGPEDRCDGGYIEVSAKLAARDLKLAGERFDSASSDVAFRWRDHKAGLDGAEIDVRSLALYKIAKEGRAPIGVVLGSAAVHEGGELRGNLVLEGIPLARIDRLGGAAPFIDGSTSGMVRLGGTLGALDVEAMVATTPIRVRGVPFGSSDLHVRMRNLDKGKTIGTTRCGGKISAPFSVDAYLKDTSKDGEVVVGGRLLGGQIEVEDLTLEQAKVPALSGVVRTEKLDLGAIARALTVEAEGESDAPRPAVVRGELTSEVRIGRIDFGHLDRAQVSFTPKAVWASRGSQRLSLTTVGVPIRLEQDTLAVPRLAIGIETGNGLRGSATLAGTVRRVTKDAALELDAALSPLDLGVLVGTVPKVTRARGKLSGGLRVRGTARAPEFDGAVQVRGGEIGVSSLPSVISGVELDIEADEKEIRVARGVGRFAGGELSLTGRVPLRQGELGIVQGSLVARHVSVSPVDGVKATADADLVLTVNPNASSTGSGRLPHVGGTVTITSFEYTRPVTLDLSGIGGGARRTDVETYDPSLDALVFAVDVTSRVPLKIKNNLVEAQLAVSPRGIHVSGTNQRIGLRGELSGLPGGRVRFFAHDFEVQRAVIRFDDPTRIAPHVDILGTTDYRRYTNTVAGGAAGSAATTAGRGTGLWRITAHAYGDANDLKVDLSSDPALSQEDIFFLLTIGLTRAEVDQVKASSAYASAAFEALGTVSGADRALKEAVPVIDDFRFGSAYSPRTGRTEPTVTLGRRVTENVRASVSTGLTEDRQLRSIIEWRLSQPLSIQGSYDNLNTQASGSVGNFGLDLRWRLEFE